MILKWMWNKMILDSKKLQGQKIVNLNTNDDDHTYKSF